MHQVRHSSKGDLRNLRRARGDENSSRAEARDRGEESCGQAGWSHAERSCHGHGGRVASTTCRQSALVAAFLIVLDSTEAVQACCRNSRRRTRSRRWRTTPAEYQGGLSRSDRCVSLLTSCHASIPGPRKSRRWPRDAGGRIPASEPGARRSCRIPCVHESTADACDTDATAGRPYFRRPGLR